MVCVRVDGEQTVEEGKILDLVDRKTLSHVILAKVKTFTDKHLGHNKKIALKNFDITNSDSKYFWSVTDLATLIKQL